MTTKPPYRIPTMSEIRALEWNGLTAASTFSGCGGSSLGYRMAGYRVLYANEFVDAARASYKANAASYTVIDGRDIRCVTGNDVLEACALEPGELDLLDGSPPCASFSTSGKREDGWGKVSKYSDKAQRTDDLFFEFARLVREIRPRTFIAENVSGLVKGTAKGYFKLILSELKSCGYSVRAQLCDAQWLGVPQARQRLIFQGVREDLGHAPAFPAPLSYRYTLRDAHPHILREKAGGRPDNWLSSNRPVSTIVASGGVVSPTAYLSGGSYVEARDATGAIVRRRITIEELRALCGFPADFQLVGTYAEQWERLGRAVPPVMMSHIAGAVRDCVLLPRKQGGIYAAE